MSLGHWLLLQSCQDPAFPQTCANGGVPARWPFRPAISTHAGITPSFQNSLVRRERNCTGWAEIRLSIIMKLCNFKGLGCWGKHSLSRLCDSCNYLHVTQTQSGGGGGASAGLGDAGGLLAGKVEQQRFLWDEAVCSGSHVDARSPCVCRPSMQGAVRPSWNSSFPQASGWPIMCPRSPWTVHGAARGWGSVTPIRPSACEHTGAQGKHTSLEAKLQ